MTRPGPGAPSPETVIVTHIHSDPDAFGAMIAARHLFPGAVPVLQPTLDPVVRELAAMHRDALGLRTVDEVDLAGVRRVVVVDTRSRARLGSLLPPLDRPEVEWVVYDHHPPAEDELPAGPGRREARGSCASLIVEELARAEHIALTPIEATLVALGIYADTGSLAYPGTTPADVRAAAWLLERGADLPLIGRWLDTGLAPPQRHLLEHLIGAVEPRRLQGLTVVVAGAAVDSWVSGIADVADRLQLVFDADVVVLVVEMGGKRTQLVARARLDGVDLKGLLAPWEGQGHPRAASAHVEGCPWQAVVASLEPRLEAHLPPEARAEDLMASPVRTVEADAPVAEAVALLDDLGHSGLVVTRRGRLAGIISRRDLERAARHGLRGTEVRHVMTPSVVTTRTDAPMSELLATMVKRDIGRLPVMRGDALVGIVTRSDLLRAQYDQDPARRSAVARNSREVGARLAAFWPSDWWALFDTISDAGGGRPIYLVGGAVRDLLLDRPNLDADLVVEGDGVAFAEVLHQALPGSKLKVHRAFGTAHVYVADGKRVDIASARTEHYDRPGALPRVAFSSLKQDLARRDFGVNCLAVRLDRGGRGELIDFFDALSDIPARVLRVLHNLSFVEDPTRALRAVRFEQTMGFRLEPRSEDFARFAFDSGACDGLAGERNRAELARLLSLPTAEAALDRLADLGALRLLDPDLKYGPAVRSTVRRVRLAARRLGSADDPDGWLALLGALLSPLGPERGSAVVGRLQLAGRQQEALRGAWAWVRRAAEATPSPLEVVRTLRDLPDTVLPLVWALAPHRDARRAVLAYKWRWRGVTLTVGGADLRALGLPPGPAYARILDHVLAARLEGRSGPEGEQELLEKLVARVRAGEEGP